MDKYITFDDYQTMWTMFPPPGVDIPPEALSTLYEGVKLPPGGDVCARIYKTWEIREDDVWIVSYPKAGTTWTQEIASAVMHDGDLETLNKSHTVFRVIFPEMSFPEEVRNAFKLPAMYKIAEELPSPRLMKSHFPGQFLPPQTWEKKAKVIYVMRNPKDTLVSAFYFIKLVMPVPQILAMPFGAFFDETMAGKGSYGPWWDHYLYYWNKRHEENVLMLRFEDMIKDLRGNVEKVSQFLGKSLSGEKLDAITDHCTFVNMKKNPMTNPDTVFEKRTVVKDLTFMRKGKVGDWKTHLTVAQNEAMDALIKEKLHGTGLQFEYN